MNAPEPERIFLAIDIGSNATKMKTWRVLPGPKAETGDFRRVPLRLGADVFESGNISEAMIEKLIALLSGVRADWDSGKYSDVRAVATSAMREAKNSETIHRRILEATGVDVFILDGELEAWLMAIGVLGCARTSGRPLVMIDIGGGSSEIIFAGSGPDSLAVKSHPIGAVRLRGQYLEQQQHAPPGAGEIQRASDALDLYFKNNIEIPTQFSGPIHGLGMAGTITTLHKMASQDYSLTPQEPLKLEHVEGLITTVSPMISSSIAGRYSIEADRAEVILAGALILRSLLRRLALGELEVRATGVADGLLAIYLDRDCGDLKREEN